MFLMEIDTLEYSRVKATSVSIRLRIFLCTLTNTTLTTVRTTMAVEVGDDRDILAMSGWRSEADMAASARLRRAPDIGGHDELEGTSNQTYLNLTPNSLARQRIWPVASISPNWWPTEHQRTSEEQGDWLTF
jgi:hypothetical protein